MFCCYGNNNLNTWNPMVSHNSTPVEYKKNKKFLIVFRNATKTVRSQSSLGPHLILLTQSLAPIKAHVELTVIDVDVGTLQYGLFPGEDKYNLIAIKFCSCCTKT